MAFCELKYFSAALGKAVAASVILPENQRGPFSVLYLLHGLSDDSSIWQRRTSIERYVADLPLIVVMPDGGRSFYCDSEIGGNYETAITRDLVQYVDTIFQTKKKSAARAVCGLSMGGYGAMKFALKFPNLFCCASSHSGALGFAHSARPEGTSCAAEYKTIPGENARGGPHDLFALAEKVPKNKRPALRFDCGKDDFLLSENRAFRKHLKAIGYPHEYREYSGNHNWEYWDTHVRDSIAFCAKHLNIAPS
jgi:S-formylglutathione hydrolase FrmB